MNEAHEIECSCNPCVGTVCECGCQGSVAQAACACGPSCVCEGECSCADAA